MAEITKQALKVENNTSFPNNNNGQITPTVLRTFNEDMIDSLVDEITYTTDSGSWNSKIDAISNDTGSYLATGSVSGAILTFEKNDGTTFDLAVTASVASISWDDVTSKPSGLVSGSSQVVDILTSVNSFTQSQETKDATLATYTGSNDTKWSNLGSQSGSWVTESETGSFARVDVSNTFTTSQTIQGGLNVTGTITANEIHTIIESSSVIYSSGSNILGDAADDTQTLNGSVNVVNQLTASGLHYPTADNGTKSFIQTDGNGNLSLQYVDAVFETVRNMSGIVLSKGTPIYISGSTGDNGNAYVADAADASKMPAMYIVGEDLAIGATGIALCHGLIEGVNTTGYPAGTIIYVAEGGGWTLSRPSGSASIVQVLGVVQKEGVGGQGVVVNQLEATLPNLQTGYTWIGNGGNQPTATPTSSFASLTDLSLLNAFTASQETKNNTLGVYTSSVDTQLTNLSTSQSIDNTKWDTIGTQSGSWITESETGSFARTDAANTFSNSNVFNGTSSLYNTVQLNGTGQGDTNHIDLDVVDSAFVLSAPSYQAGPQSINSQYSASAPAQQINLILKGQNATTDYIVSGSNNIGPWPSAPTAGFKRYTTSHNLYLGNGGVPQISGSMAWSPSINGNVVAHTQTNPITWRGPVSSSASTFNHNIIMGGQINLGTSATNNFEKAVSGVNVTGNALFNGIINAVANTTNLTNSPSISGNVLFGAGITLNMYSSSVSYNSNIQNGGIVVNNRFAPTAGTVAAALSPRVNVNTIYGLGHDLNIDGTNTSTTQAKQFNYNIIAGMFISSSVPTGDNSGILATGIIGHALTITGSATSAAATGQYVPNDTQGSLFVGRFNAQNGTRSKTAETVFAVGTGTSTNRKTGFLIDSGSNTFVEGTLNVSGSSSFTGSVSITQTIKLTPQDPLPSAVVGELAVSGSSLYFYDGTWRQVSLV
jgi:hypothetical protein